MKQFLLYQGIKVNILVVCIKQNVLLNIIKIKM